MVKNLKLTINTDKTKYILFKTDVEFTLNIVHDNTPVEKVSEFNYLGLSLDYKLCWDAQINKIKRRLSPIAGVFRKLRNIIPIVTKRSLFFAFFNSIITYMDYYSGVLHVTIK